MKRFLSVVLLLVLTLSLSACGGEREPLLGKWEAKAEQYEASVTFEQDGEILTGVWTFYDYGDKEWGEYGFRVKERTDFTATLLNDDGTMDIVLFYAQGNTLHLDGITFTNAQKNVKLSEDMKEKTLDVNGKLVPVGGFDHLYMGMTLEEVELAVGRKLKNWQASEHDNKDYKYYTHCDYYAFLYGYKHLGFDENRKLVHVSEDNHDATDSMLQTLLAQLQKQLGQYEFRSREFGDVDKYYDGIYTWRVDGYTILVEENRINGNLQYVTTKWFKSPVFFAD